MEGAFEAQEKVENSPVYFLQAFGTTPKVESNFSGLKPNSSNARTEANLERIPTRAAHDSFMAFDVPLPTATSLCARVLGSLE